LFRILYSAASSGGLWGEHELDYILFLRSPAPALAPSSEEVAATEWVARPHLPEFLRELHSSGGGVTPWFKLISKDLLPFWWKNLDEIESFQDHQTIHKYY